MSQRFKSPQAEESVACNLIPMIDIMFLLLLFFMLGADMSQRELEEVELPKADQVKEDDNTKVAGTNRTNVNIFHTHTSSGFTCETHKAGNVCRDMNHWAIAIRSHEYTLETLAVALKDEADRGYEETPPGGKALSTTEMMIRADRNAPYGYIQKVIEAAASVGIYKILVGAARPEPS
jgi:biopolymer transport protein ExbD